jgi:hypothetical protein
MFYLIGVNHNAQRFSPGSKLDGDQTKLEWCLSKAIKDCHPKLIAVEENEDTLVDKRTGVVDESIPRNIAQRHGIEPILLEPSDHDKTRLGYKCNSEIHAQLFTSGLLRDCPPSLQTAAVDAVEVALVFPLRELFWIEKLKKYLESEVIVVLGENHIDSFSRRLQELGVPSKVLCRGIGVTAAQMCEIEATKRFPADNPNLFEAMIKGMRERDLRLKGC